MEKHIQYPKKAGIYKLTCDNNGKVYIGKAVNIYNRMASHKTCGRTPIIKHPIQGAIRKYGWDSFKVEILEILEDFNKDDDDNKLLISQKESDYIKLFDSTNTNIGYNICKYSTDRTGLKHSEETKEKIRQSHLGKKKGPHSEEAKERIGQAHLGKKVSEETREKLRQANIGKKMSEESIEKMRQSRIGRVVSDTTKEKLRQIHKGRPSPRKDFKHSEESKEKIRQSVTGRKHSEESKKRMSIAQTGIKNKRPGYRPSEETKEKMRQSVKNRKIKKELSD